MSDNNPHKAVQFLIDTAPLYSKAKASRMFLEEFRKSRKAQLMSQAWTDVLWKQETYAYAHPDYEAQLKGLRDATEKEEALKFMLVAAQMRHDTWKTNEYSKRQELKNL